MVERVHGDLRTDGLIVALASVVGGLAMHAQSPAASSSISATKDEHGLWSVTTPVPVAPDTCRFNFRVNGVLVPNPQGTTFSPAQVGTNGTFEVLGPGGAFQTYNKDIAHGAGAEVEYWSKSLGVKRRAHAYTPPGNQQPIHNQRSLINNALKR